MSTSIPNWLDSGVVLNSDEAGWSIPWDGVKDPSIPVLPFIVSTTSSGYTLVASGGQYSKVGQNAVIRRSRRLAVQGGSYSVFGQAALVAKGRKLDALGGSYVVSGQACVLLRAKRIGALGGHYTTAGQAANIRRSRVLFADGGAYAFAGQQAQVHHSRYLAVGGGAYTFTGQQIVFLKSGGGVWPAEADVRFGVVYGPTGTEYVGQYVDTTIKFDLVTNRLVKPLSSRVAMSL